MIYVKALNVTYGIMKAVLIFYKKFVGDINSIIFKLKPYEPFVTNKLINYKQMAMVWYTYDIKVIHNSKKIVTIIVKWPKKTYEQLFGDGSGKINIFKDNIHEYLGMNLYYSEPEEVNINIIPYIEEVLKDSANHYYTMKTSATPASDQLFKNREDAIVLEETQANIYHNFFAKELFATKRSIPDIV